MADPVIMVTNDDGIESVGFRELVAALEPLGTVVAVAPAENHSAVGRSIDPEAHIEEHPLGYVVHGSPATCVVTGVTALGLDPDVVVSGINKGANLGSAILGRSGTIAAAIEAAYLDYPAIAVSMYIPFERIEGEFRDYRTDPEQFEFAARTATYLTERVINDQIFDGIDYLNVNTPMADRPITPRPRITTPADGYYTTAELEGERAVLRDRQFELLYTGDIKCDDGTDRGTLAAGDISISPLRLPHQGLDTEARETIASATTGPLGRILTRESI